MREIEDSAELMHESFSTSVLQFSNKIQILQSFESEIIMNDIMHECVNA